MERIEGCLAVGDSSGNDALVDIEDCFVQGALLRAVAAVEWPRARQVGAVPMQGSARIHQQHRLGP